MHPPDGHGPQFSRGVTGQDSPRAKYARVACAKLSVFEPASDCGNKHSGLHPAKQN